jgi:hypothetical protein
VFGKLCLYFIHFNHVFFSLLCTADVPYEITVYTSDISGAGTSANVFIVLYGIDSSTKEVVLADTNKKKKGTFNKGSVDQFVKEASICIC